MSEYSAWVEKLEAMVGGGSKDEGSEGRRAWAIIDGEEGAVWNAPVESQVKRFDVFLQAADGGVERTEIRDAIRHVQVNGDVVVWYVAGQAPGAWRRALSLHCVETCPKHGRRAYIAKRVWEDRRDRGILFRCIACGDAAATPAAGVPRPVGSAVKDSRSRGGWGAHATMIVIDDFIAAPKPTMRCGCGKHDVDPTGDVYAQHRVWSVSFQSGDRPNTPEALTHQRVSPVKTATGIGVSADKPAPLPVQDPTGDDVAADAYGTTGNSARLDDVIDACRSSKPAVGGVVRGDPVEARPVVRPSGPESLIIQARVMGRPAWAVSPEQLAAHERSGLRLQDDLLDSVRLALQTTEDNLFTLGHK